ACSIETSFPCLSGLFAWPVYAGFINQNVSALSGGAKPQRFGRISADLMRNLRDPNGRSVEQIFDMYNQARDPGDGSYTPVQPSRYLKAVSYSFSQPLSWPTDPPQPMLLTDMSLQDGSIADPTAEVDLLTIRKD